jgi:hypothetical protein
MALSESWILSIPHEDMKNASHRKERKLILFSQKGIRYEE